MKIMERTFLVVILFFIASVSQAGDVEAGKEKSMNCAACHGGAGIKSTNYCIS